MIPKFAEMTAHVDNPTYAQQGIAELKASGLRTKARHMGTQTITAYLDNIKTQRLKMNDQTSADAADAAIKEINAVN